MEVVSLRDLRESDAKDMMLWAGDEQVTRSLTWDTYTSEEDVVQFIRTIASPHPWFKAVCLNGTAVGSLTITPGSGIYACKAVLGYVLARKHWGKGIMTRAVELALKDAFRELHPVVRIEAIVNSENIASQSVLLKAGFHNAGLQRKYFVLKGKVVDCYIFTIISTDQCLLSGE